jgi:FAD/FMN-containing dehydrogenase
MPTSMPGRWARAALLLTVLASSGCALFARHAAPDGGVTDPTRPAGAPAAEVWQMPPDDPEVLATKLAIAAAHGRPVAIAGANRSQGGQAFVPGGVVIDMRAYRAMAYDAPSRTLVVRAGARWAEVLRFLQARGLSPAVMQGYNDFSIGGSLAANCHGAQGDAWPIAHTVKGFSIMLADGHVVHASRSGRSPLFRHAHGG